MAYSFFSPITLGNYIDFGSLNLYRELTRLKYFRISVKRYVVLGCGAKLPIIYLSVGKLIRKISCKSQYPNSIDNGKYTWID